MSEIDQDLAARLLRAVEASPLKRAEVAAHSGIDKSTLTKLLAGQRRVSIEQLKALAGALGLKHTDFMSDPGAAVEPSPTTLPEGLKVYLAKW